MNPYLVPETVSPSNLPAPKIVVASGLFTGTDSSGIRMPGV